MPKRQTIGKNDPLDSLIGYQGNNSEKENKGTRKNHKQRITVQISADVVERVKNAVYWTPGLTLASLAEKAFTKAIDDLEEKREAPFPKRKEELKTGRPLS